MRVLIAGGYGTFCEYIIARLKRENHDVYIISGKDGKKTDRLSAIRIVNYNFNLTDEKLRFIIDSVMPEAIIFLGAFDQNYTFSENQTTALEFTAGLSNLLDVTSRIKGIKCFVYLSTAMVYDKTENAALTEDCKKNPRDVKNIIISEGEELCLAFAELTDIKFNVLRFSDIYGVLSDKNPDLFETLFTVAVSNEALEPDVDKCINPIYVSDAVDAVFKAITDEKNEGIFNVSGTQTELSYIYKKIKELAYVPVPDVTYRRVSLFSKFFSKKIIINNNYEIENNNYTAKLKKYKIIDFIVDCSLFKEHYGYRSLVDIDTGLERMYKDFRKRNEKKEEPLNKKIKKYKFVKEFEPLLENFIMFAVLVSVEIWQQSVAWMKNFDFTVLYIIIISITLGLFQGSIAAFLSIALLIWQNIRQGTSAFDMFINFDVMIRILEIFIIAAICGYSKDKMRTVIGETKAELEDNMNELDTIYKINDTNMNIKHELNERLTNYEDSLAKLYSVADKLNELQPDAVFFAAVSVVMDIMNTNDVSIYIVTGDNFKMCRLAAKTSTSDRVLKKSLPLTELGELAEFAERDEIFVNRDLHENLPMMAAPIFLNNKLASIIMIWNMDFVNLTLYSENRFLVLSRLISSAIGRAFIYNQDMQNSMYLPGTHILTNEAFESILNIHKEAAKNNTASYYIMRINNEDMKIGELSEKVGGLIRVNDYMGQCADADDSLYILLVNTNSDDAKFVHNRLEKAGLTVKEVAL